MRIRTGVQTCALPISGTKWPFLSRRMLVAGGLALPLAVLAPPPLRAAAIPPSGVLRFTVLRGGSPMGTHRIAFRQEGRALRVGSEEHTSELQSLMRISYAVFCLTKKNTTRLVKRGPCTSIPHDKKTNQPEQ